MEQLQVKFKKLHEDSILPYYASEEAAGLDCTVYSKEWDDENQVYSYGLGFAVEIPKGYVGLILPRSSVYKEHMIMSNSVGVIDADYRGEVHAKFYADGDDDFGYTIGERCCQLIIIPYPKIIVVSTDKLSETKRGTGGHGSTGLSQIEPVALEVFDTTPLPVKG